jgi:hypothetical protein
MDKAKAEMFAEWDAMGQDQVRMLLPMYSGLMRKFAVEWLAQFDQADRLSNAASTAETLDLVRRQAEAAEDANRKADIANTIALLAIVIAIIAIAVSIIGLFLKHG